MNTKLLILFSLTVVICSCQKISFQESNIINGLESITKGTSIEDYSISMKDMEAYSHFAKLAYGKETREIIPVPDDENPAFYIVNFDKGWKLISADMRSSTVLGESEDGAFSMSSENENMLAWVCSLADEVQELKKFEGIPSTCDEAAIEEIQSNVNFWKAITADKEFIRERTQKTKTEIDPDDIGYWEFVGVELDTVFYDAPDRLVTTHWDQGSNYNAYCPPILYGNSTCNPQAGCVAVAGAQMAYFLHNKIGLPVTAPTSAIIYDYIVYADGTYFWPYYFPVILGSESSAIWPYMLNNSLYNGYYSAALLISKIGRSVNMEYTLNGSWATTSDLVNYFNSEGISCDYNSFSEARVASSLLNGFPVIIRAQSSRGGHCFIIDGYKRSHVTYIYLYLAQ